MTTCKQESGARTLTVFSIGLPYYFLLFCASILHRDEYVIAQTTRVIAKKIGCFGDSRGTSFLGIHGISCMGDQSIVVTDKLGRAVKKIDTRGIVLRETDFGSSGFNGYRGPGACSTWRDLLAVAEFAGTRITIADTSFNLKSSFVGPGPVADLKFDPRGGLWMSTYTGDGTKELFELDTSGITKRVIALRNTSGDAFDDVVVLSIERNGYIVVGYLTRNIVEVWDTGGVFRKEFRVPCLPLRSPRTIIGRALDGEGIAVPQGEVIRSITSDRNGRIFVLGGSYAEFPDQTVIVLDSTGKYLDQFVLSAKAFAIAVGMNGLLYSVEHDRTQITKYKLYTSRRSSKRAIH